jgi:hypothetical protein
LSRLYRSRNSTADGNYIEKAYRPKLLDFPENEIHCLAPKQYSAGELVVGNSVNSMGFLGSHCAGLTNNLGGEVPQLTQAIQEGRGCFLFQWKFRLFALMMSICKSGT